MTNWLCDKRLDDSMVRSDLLLIEELDDLVAWVRMYYDDSDVPIMAVKLEDIINKYRKDIVGN